MKEKNFCIVFIILLFCILCTTGRSAAMSDAISVYYYDRPPYRIKISEAEVSGIMVDITKLIFQNMGISYKFEEIPFKRLLEELKSPIPACFPGILQTKDRKEFYLYSDPVFKNEPLLILINSWSRKSLSEKPTIEEVLTSHLKLGVVDGYSYGSWYDEKIKQYHTNQEK
ncbi:MAG: transporter substrate-binding domain-containing protein [Desulfobacteraceae bacterium]|nr:transporter substrate-binding domain-containing protein [Desulfobacteraceae bacterium]MBC2755049.1 transporter substrate-binding domain-containing protein [Desulfobacteraceae bacterium]